MKKQKYNFPYLFIKILIFGGLIFWYFLLNTNQKHKNRNALEKVYYGGSAEEVNKSFKKVNTKISTLRTLTTEKQEQFKNILIFTNNNQKGLKASIQANRKYRNEHTSSHQIGRNYIRENEEIIKYIDDFFKYKDSLGFNIFLSDTYNNKEFRVNNLTVSDTITKYIALQFYYYNKKLKTELTKQIQKDEFYTNKTKAEKIAKLDSLQFSKVIFTEAELQNKKMENELKALFVPDFNNHSDDIFYFSCYNKILNDSIFKDKIVLFKQMFFQQKKNNKGLLRKIKISTLFDEENTEN
ncbi:hypothetical protein [Tenacibaculum jejuense]|uniref:Uncharacterized protein n=1 Tax=Tenacibaculum jejuense TaxID=584609 RepID=A0A238UD55_9FLAO|nr:hypothetical protein [Tenacibaculum jejuense]SNR16414.1 protein of unknown function [Tenacibaculum jejuense]